MTSDEAFPSRGFFVKHLKGEYSFARSFWLNMIAIAWLLPTLALIIQGLTSADVPPRIAAAEYLLVVTVSAFLIYWGAIGALHSGRRYVKSGGSKLWFTAALLVMWVAALDTIAQFIYAPGILVQNVRIVFTGRYAAAPTIQQIENGTAVLIHGTIQVGTAEALRKSLHGLPNVATIVLDSSGGMFDESNQIAKLIAGLRLNTYVQHECSSACTVAFLAGRRRCISDTAKIGFHAGRRLSVAPSISTKGLENMQHDEYAAAGLPAGFIDRILATPTTTLWIPSRAELLDAHVLTPGCSNNPNSTPSAEAEKSY
jgi:hypothetical protein